MKSATVSVLVGALVLACGTGNEGDPEGSNPPAVTLVQQSSALDTSPPTVVITSPAAGNVTGTITISAQVTDNVKVSGVNFYIDGWPIGYVYAPPYQMTWDSNAYPNGPRTLQVTAYDSSNNQTTKQVAITIYNPHCEVSFNPTYVSSGGSTTFTLTSWGPIPGGSRAYLYGKKNGVPDVTNQYYGLPSFSQTVTNPFGFDGAYERWIVIRDAYGRDVCTTNHTQVYFLAPTCEAWFNRSEVPVGESVDFSLNSYGDIPTGSRAYLYGTKNGVPDENGLDFGEPWFTYNITNAPGLAGTYVRWIVVRTPSGVDVCTTGETTTTFY